MAVMTEEVGLLITHKTIFYKNLTLWPPGVKHLNER